MSKYAYKVKGSLLAAALGDGLGAFTECLHYKTAAKKYPYLPPTNFQGSIEFTDDTALRLVVYDAMLSGRIDAWNLADQWKSGVSDPRVYWISELYVTALLSMGEDPHKTGHRNLLADNAAMAADPFGTLYPCNDELAALRAFETMSVCQSGVGLEGAMAVAASVSTAMADETKMDDVVDAAGRHVGKKMKSRIDDAVDIVSSNDEPHAKLYEELVVEDGTADLVWQDVEVKPPVEMAKRLVDLGVRREDISMGVSPLEVVPVAVAYASTGANDPTRAIRDAASFGRDSDTISGIAGAILGAYHGVDALPRDVFNRLPKTLLSRAEEISRNMERIVQKGINAYALNVDALRKLFSV